MEKIFQGMELKKKHVVTISKTHSFKGHDGALYALEAGTDPDSFFAAGSDRVVSRWSLSSGEAAAIASAGSVIYSLRLVPSRNILLMGTASGLIHVIDLEKKKEVFHYLHHPFPIFDIAYSEKLQRFYTASGDGTIAAWSA